jgi:hypothetical protein
MLIDHIEFDERRQVLSQSEEAIKADLGKIDGTDAVIGAMISLANGKGNESMDIEDVKDHLDDKGKDELSKTDIQNIMDILVERLPNLVTKVIGVKSTQKDTSHVRDKLVNDSYHVRDKIELNRFRQKLGDINEVSSNANDAFNVNEEPISAEILHAPNDVTRLQSGRIIAMNAANDAAVVDGPARTKDETSCNGNSTTSVSSKGAAKKKVVVATPVGLSSKKICKSNALQMKPMEDAKLCSTSTISNERVLRTAEVTPEKCCATLKRKVSSFNSDDEHLKTPEKRGCVEKGMMKVDNDQNACSESKLPNDEETESSGLRTPTTRKDWRAHASWLAVTESKNDNNIRCQGKEGWVGSHSFI